MGSRGPAWTVRGELCLQRLQPGENGVVGRRCRQGLAVEPFAGIQKLFLLRGGVLRSGPSPWPRSPSGSATWKPTSRTLCCRAPRRGWLLKKAKAREIREQDGVLAELPPTARLHVGDRVVD